MLKRVMSQFSGEIVLSHFVEKLPRGTLLILKKIHVPKNINDKSGGREGTSFFSIKSFCPTVPKTFVEEPFCVRTFLASKNVTD